MSLLSTDIALLLPGRALLRCGGKLHASQQGGGWEGALSSLSAALPAAGKVRTLRVLLSHHFAGLHVLPPPAMRLSSEEMGGWLQEHLLRDYGTESETWRLAWQDVAPGQAVPVTTLPQLQYDSLHTLLVESGVRLTLLAPWFQIAWARHAGAARRAGWLALAEPGRLALARLERGRLHDLTLTRLETAGAIPLGRQIRTAVTRDALLRGVEQPPQVPVFAPELSLAADVAGAKTGIQALAPGAGWEAVLA